MRETQRMREGLLSLIKRLPSGLTMAEIGSFKGESAELFAASGKFTSITCVDPWPKKMRTSGGKVIDGEKIEAIFDTVRAKYPIITKQKMKSLEAAASCLWKYDFVYIDADHRYQHVAADIDAWLPLAYRFIGGHDFNLDHKGVIQAVQERFKQPVVVFWDTSWVVKLAD